MSKQTPTPRFAALVRNVRAAKVAIPDYSSAKAEEYQAAKAAYLQAIADLRTAMEQVNSGPCGAAFITNRWAPHSRESRELTLHINRRPVATLENGWLDLIKNGEEKFANFKNWCRRRDRLYKMWRRNCIAALVRNGLEEARDCGRWHFFEGQKGGTFVLNTNPDIRVSACSALKAAAARQQEPGWEREAEFDRALYGARF